MSIQPVSKAILGEKKKKKASVYLIKNSKGERGEKAGGGGGGPGGGGGGTLTSSWKGWAEFYGCLKNKSQMTSHCNGNHSKT